ncbi:MAG TPA: ATP-dependent DNA helicase RecQ [Baekduia sp.]|uniref:RecQ family ATP-dependent DNA helicase n=1 Tax=Baekduia sp. TaxID=2600305 RepID=UPI002D7A30F8|nr:ATP-dependent DNA helicase RecQ [Baekduia sp.]HET6509756.1 ATP-dependent DNA helicase RecQ [Baekduia sp.]
MDPRAALHQHFGFADFRPGQEAAVTAAVEGRDVLVVMPTGAGKSLCYQLPALMRDDLTIVVSPLVSLMQDQVEALERRAPGAAGVINSQQDAASNADVLARARAGSLKLLYVAPERFSSPGFLEAIRTVPIGLFVVDEAHCVSQWGHDFRPDYFRLADAARWLGAQALVASTATATPQVARDIVARLGLRQPTVVTTGFDRPNLSFSVVPCATTADKHARIAAALREDGARPAIVYAGTRKACDALAQRLGVELEIEVLSYHAGLGRAERADVQRRFMGGDVEVVVATNAFGMGVDKADVRTVAHEVVPPSIEAYYQEAGRAGRDGAPGRALLFAEKRDKSLHVFFIQRAEVSDGVLDQVAGRLLGAAVDGRFDVAVSYLDDEPERVRAIVGHLARAGVVQPAPSPMDRVRGRVVGTWDGRTQALARASAAEGGRARWRQYRAVWAFVEGDACRRQTILRHFGDPAAPAPEVACCDVCDPSLIPAAPSRALAGAAGAARGGSSRSGTARHETMDAAILAVVRTAKPSIGRTRVAEVLRGGQAKAIVRNAWDELPEYGTYAHLSAKRVVDRIDAMIEEGLLASTGGARPTLKATAQAPPPADPDGQSSLSFEAA